MFHTSIFRCIIDHSFCVNIYVKQVQEMPSNNLSNIYIININLQITAKTAKLLLMMDRGLGSENHGKTLKEIDIQLQSWNQQSSGKDETGNDYLLH